jgi:A/G-specific adenine glycosylase
MIEKKKIKQLQRIVWKYYKEHGRHTLPWRKTKNPYRILVSEVMLQQTQVTRVIPKYEAFLKKFPSLTALAQASLREVLVVWQGLGYNRRAKALHQLAGVVVREYGGKLPMTYEALVRLPGVGPYTGSAVCAFAYNTPHAMIETNIRTVFFHHIFPMQEQVTDAELMVIAQTALDTRRPREWHWALMDYGAYLKEQGVRSNAKSKHYTPQATFKGSDREVRGTIIRTLTQLPCASEKEVVRITKIAPARVRNQLKKLEKEGMIRKKDDLWSL